MIVSYPAVFYKYQEGNYDVSFPDFGVVTGEIIWKMLQEWQLNA